MKKTLSVISLIVVVVMLASVMAFAANLDDYQTVIYTGELEAAEGIVIDGAKDRAYTCVTPDGANMTLVDANFYSKKPSGREIAVVPYEDLTEDQQAFVDDMSTYFYVAQDDDYVYIFVEQNGGDKSYQDENGTTYSFGGVSKIISNLRLGFNPDDYTQQIDLYTHGQYATQGSASTFCSVSYSKTWVRAPFVAVGFAEFDDYTAENALPIIEYTDADGVAKDSVAVGSTGYRAYEMKISKEAVAELYDEEFGEEASFDSMYIGLSSSDYAWANSKDNFCLRWVTGNVISIDDADDNELTTWIPDKVVFSDKPVETEAPTTEAPATEAPATEAPATEAPTTEVSTTEVAITEPPETEAPATEAPTTEVSTTEAPKTEAPITEASVENNAGCASSVSVAGIALLAALGTCTAFVAKKKD